MVTQNTAWYGVDIDNNFPGGGLPDLNPLGKLVINNQLLGQALLNRLFCVPGSYIQVPDFGIDLSAYLNSAIGSAGINVATLSAQIIKELQKDIRVQIADVDVSFVNENLTININITPISGGNFSLTIAQAGQSFTTIFEEPQ